MSLGVVTHIASWDIVNGPNKPQDNATTFGKLDPYFKSIWLLALRSGNYTQIQDRLRNGSGMCCLGVACEVYDSTKWKLTGDFFRFSKDTYTLTDDLNSSLREELGLSREAMDHLIEMNDTHKKSFNEIADWIEKNL